jgi:ribosomal protein L11 methyltransferase
VTDAPLKTKVVLDADDVDAARAAAGVLAELFEPAPLAVTQFETGPASFRIEAYFESAPDLAALDLALRATGRAGLSAPRLEAVPDENWVAISQASLPPVEAGRFIVHGSHDAARIGRRLNAILIDAGEAFGTAHHATTEGCLEAIDRLTRRRRYGHVLDLGCGSGVLAIAASRALPHAHLIASDVDPVATGVARENIRANGAAGRIDVVTAVGFDHPTLRAARHFDLIIANILAAPLVMLAPAMRGALKPGGTIILSGLLSTQAADVIAAYRAQGFRVAVRRDFAGWSTLTLG